MSRLGRHRDTIGFFVLAALLAWMVMGPFLAHAPPGGFDWCKERMFYSTLRAGLRAHGAPPLAFLDVPPQLVPPYRTTPTLMQSASYLGNPEVLTFSPLLPLLAVVPVDLFLQIYFIVHVLVGALGIWLLARRLSLPPWTALALFGLTVLNPWLVQHLLIGYTPHITFTLAPLVIALLVGDRFTRADWIGASAVEALILYEGGLHVFNWLNAGLLVFALVAALVAANRSLWKRAAAALGGGVLLAAPKLAAVAQSVGGWRRLPQTGIRSLHDVWGLLTDGQRDPFRLPQAYNVYSTNLYDGAIYMGVPFVLLVAAALAVALWRRDRRALAPVAVALACGVFAWRSVWPSLAKVVPLADMEIYPPRFLFVSLLALVGLLVGQLAGLAERGGRWRWLPLVLVPTLLATGLRAREYTALAQRPIPADCSAEVLEAAIAAPKAARAPEGPLPTSRSGATITITAGTAREIALPWLRAARASDFTVEGGHIVRTSLESGMIVAPTASEVRISPHGYHFWWFALASWALFLVVTAAFRRLERAPT
jgi:hypothetical protein